MRVLIINDHGITGGGTENRIRLLVEELLNQNFFEEIHLLAKYTQKELPDKIIFHQSEKSTFWETIKIIKNHKIDIVQVHNLLSLTPTPILAAKLLRKPIIFFAHDYWPVCGRRSYIPAETASQQTLCEKTQLKKCTKCIGWKSVLKLKIWKLIVNLSTTAISASNFLAQQYEKEGVLKNKWQIVNPWIEQRIFDGAEEYKPTEKIILFVGSLIEFKGAWVAAKSLKNVVEKIPEAKLVFIGGEQSPEYPYRRFIEDILKKDNTTNNVLFLGKQDWQTIKTWHSKASALVFPSVCMETFGLAWAEAMASGVPIIASAVGSVPEFIEDKGIIIPLRDETALAHVIIEILNNKKLAEKLSHGGKKYAQEQFNLTNAVNKIKKSITYHKSLMFSQQSFSN